MRRLNKFFRLPIADKALLLRCVLSLAFHALALAVIPYARFEKMFAPRLRRTQVGVAPGHIAAFVSLAAKAVPGATCLPQALTARAMLARAGYPSRIRIGVAPAEKGRFTAHAWLLHGDDVLVGGTSEEVARYTRLTDLEAGTG